ncbi:MAG: Hemolysin, chromosomal, partial [Planctomycetota bacterium]
MSLRKWLTQFVLPISNPHRPVTLARRRWQRRSGQRLNPFTTHVSPSRRAELLEDRILPASLTWVGDLDNSWARQDSSDTNWSGDVLPQDGDSLYFDGAAAGVLLNNTAAGNSYTLTFAAGGYTITGHSIALDNPGTDVIQIAGENLLQTPLLLDGSSSVEVQSGVLDLQGAVTGTAGLTKLGSGTLVLTGPASYTGATFVNAGGLQVDGSFTGTDPISISPTATLAGDGTLAGNVSLAGVLTPGSINKPAAAIGSLSLPSLSMASSSTLKFQISGPATGEFDTLSVAGNASLNGTLAIEFTSSYVPSAGSVFRVLTAGSVTGQFTNWSGLTYTNGVLLPIQTPEGLILVATPFPTGALPLFTNTHAAGEALANFFGGSVDSVEVSGTIQVLNQSLGGTFNFTRRAASGSNPALTIISATGVAMQFNGSSGNLVSITNGSGVLVLTSTGLAADIAVSVSESIDNVSFAGNFGLAINSTGTAISETITVNGTSRTISLPAGPYVRLTADNSVLTTGVFDVQGDFT